MGSQKRKAFVTEIPALRTIDHSEYESGIAFENDIALVELQYPAPLSDTIRVINLPRANSVVADGTDLMATGWGQIGKATVFHQVLGVSRAAVA